MIESHEDMRRAAQQLKALSRVIDQGQLEVKAAFTPHYDDLQTIRANAVAEGFLPEEEPHEVEGRHMLTLTWHF